MTGLARSTALVFAAGLLAAAAVPWRVSRSVVVSAFAEAPRPGPHSGLLSGLQMRVAAEGRVTFKLLPRPRLQATNLSASAADGAILLDAPLLKAELDIPSLLRGAWRLTTATLVEPTLTVDVDGLAARAAGGPAASVAGVAGAGRLSAGGMPMTLRLRSGLVRTRSASGFADLLATAVDASAAWSGDGLVVSGTAAVRGTVAQFTGALQRPALGLTAAGSPASLQVESPVFDFSADGVLSGRPATAAPTGAASTGAAPANGARPQFVGRASLATSSLPRLLRLLGDGPLPLASKRAQVAGDLVARPHELSLSNAELKLDRSLFEGTLAWRQDGGRGLLAGTLATDMLDCGALAGEGPDAPEVGALYRRTLTASPLGADVDLRVSATAARIGRVALADAAFGALVRGDRLELTLDEAAAYRGLVKARAVVTLGPGGIDAHAELSAKHVELGPLSDELSGRGRVDGAVTGHASLDGHGASLRAVVSDLAGDGQVAVEGARVAGLSLAGALRRLGHRARPADGSLADGDRGAPTVFDRGQWDVSIRDGVVRIPRGKLTAPGVALDFGAETGLSDGRVDLQAVAVQADQAGVPSRDGLALPFDLKGFWTGPLTLVERHPGLPGLPGLPPIALPLGAGFGAGR